MRTNKKKKRGTERVRKNEKILPSSQHMRTEDRFENT
jgi:hypothetical protein